MCISVPSALAHCLGRPGGSVEPAGTPELGGTVSLIVPRHSGPCDLVSLIFPAGRIYFPPILWERKLRTGDGKTICSSAPCEIGTHVPGGEGLPLEPFLLGLGVGGLACPGPPGLALLPCPLAPSPAQPQEGSCSCWKMGNARPSQAGVAEGQCPLARTPQRAPS